MATKEENLKRLHELAERLGREPDTSGSAADIAQRVAELEEELDDTGSSGSRAESLLSEKAPDEYQNDAVSVRTGAAGRNTDALATVVALVTLHIDGLHATQEKALELVLKGTTFRIPGGVATCLAKDSRVKML
ncbi:DNA-packaging protein FI [Escherichia coli]|nr:DNA-packaging protein FI [Escherichia coli]EJE8507768.1 DNA-packaging protein FI [Shigella sonnei]